MIWTIDTYRTSETARLKISKTRVIYLKLVTIVLIYNFSKFQIMQSNLWRDEKADTSAWGSHGNSRLNSKLLWSSCDIENATFTCYILSPLNSFICKTQRSPDTPSGNYYFFHCVIQWLIKYTSLQCRDAVFSSSYTQGTSLAIWKIWQR